MIKRSSHILRDISELPTEYLAGELAGHVFVARLPGSIVQVGEDFLQVAIQPAMGRRDLGGREAGVLRGKDSRLAVVEVGLGGVLASPALLVLQPLGVGPGPQERGDEPIRRHRLLGAVVVADCDPGLAFEGAMLPSELLRGGRVVGLMCFGVLGMIGLDLCATGGGVLREDGGSCLRPQAAGRRRRRSAGTSTR